MMERFQDGGIQASQWVVNVVVMALWVPLIAVLWGAGIAVAGIGYQVAVGEISVTGVGDALTSAINPTLALLVVGGAVGYLYLTLAVITFGEGSVEASTEQATEIADQLENEIDNGDGDSENP